jgi:hypothetical protein
MQGTELHRGFVLGNEDLHALLTAQIMLLLSLA